MKKYRRGLRLAACLLALATCAVLLCSCLHPGKADSYTAAMPVIVVGSDNYPPFIYLNNDSTPTGIDVDIATEVIDRIHTTAGSHSRVMCIEIMGNKAGWLTLYSGIAGGADIILLPEQPYDIDRVCEAVERRAKRGSNFSIIAVAEGAMNVDEAKLKRKEWAAKRAEAGYTTATNRIAAAVQKKTGMETRVCIPGHMQRGGSPSAYDRVLATQFGSYAAKLVEIEQYGVTVALVNNHVISNRLEDIAGKTRNIPEGCELLTVAKRMGISLG